MAQTNRDDGLPQVTLAVLGAQGVGKSTFVQNSFDLRTQPESAFTIKKMSLDDVVYTVRLVEMSLDDVSIIDRDRIKWPKSLDGQEIPHIDGVLTLYDVTHHESFDEIPEILRRFSSQLILVSSPKNPLVHAYNRLTGTTNSRICQTIRQV